MYNSWIIVNKGKCINRAWLNVWIPLGYSPENGIRVRAALKSPLSCPLGHFLRPLFHDFSVPESPTFAWNYIFCENCISKPQNHGKVQFLDLKFDQISVPRASSWTKNKFFKTPNFAAVHSLSPIFSPSGYTLIPKWKLGTPWGLNIVSKYCWPSLGCIWVGVTLLYNLGGLSEPKLSVLHPALASVSSCFQWVHYTTRFLRLTL